jgi:hypothetical protein
MRATERGSVVIWMLGLSVVLLLFGGLAIDYWRGLALQREMAAIADSAAIAGASGIDEEHYRATGEVLLDETRSTDVVLASVELQDRQPSRIDVSISADRSAVTVTVEAAIELGLLGILVDDSEPLLIRASATASPRLVP